MTVESDGKSASGGGDTLAAPLVGSDSAHGAFDSLLKRGAALGRYMLLRKIGAGGMGVVWAAYDPDLDRKVAIKLMLITGEGAGHVDSRIRLLREAKALAKLSHPNVVPVFDMGTIHGRVWICMELIDGVTLREWLDEAPRSWQEVVGTMAGAARGLAAAHAKGLVHRDFKPGNVMIASDGSVKVMDFGLVWAERPEKSLSVDDLSRTQEQQLIASLTRTGALMGTPVYMAPEQFLMGKVDTRTDQFGFCVTLWEALYRQRPFEAQTFAGLAFAVTNAKLDLPDSWSSVPRWLRHLLQRGLQVEPAERWPSMVEIVRELDKERSRRRAGVAVVLGGLALLAAGLGVASRLTEKADPCALPVGTFSAVWDAERQRMVAASFEATRVEFADDSFGRVARGLDSYIDDWTAIRAQTCREGQALRSSSSCPGRAGLGRGGGLGPSPTLAST